MRAVLALGALSAALALASAAPAFAAEPDPAATAAAALLTSKIDAAIANATSYRVAVTGPGGLTLDIRSFGPDRVRVASTANGTASESIVIGTAMYYRTEGGAWKAYPVPTIAHMRRNRLYMGAPDTLLEPLADRADTSGAAIGAFRSVAIANSQVPGLMECTYDKYTFRPRACTVTLQGLSTPLQVAYAGWDDPGNAIEPPAGVAPPAPFTAQPPMPAAPASPASPRPEPHR